VGIVARQYKRADNKLFQNHGSLTFVARIGLRSHSASVVSEGGAQAGRACSSINPNPTKIAPVTRLKTRLSEGF